MDKIIAIVAKCLQGTDASLPYLKASMLQVVSMNCLFNLLYGFVDLGIAVLLFSLARSAYRSFLVVEKNNEGRTYYDSKEEVSSFVIGQFWISLVSGLLLSIGAFFYLLDFWSWIGVFHPDLYLIHRAVDIIVP